VAKNELYPLNCLFVGVSCYGQALLHGYSDYSYTDFLNKRGLTWFFKKTALLISHFWRSPLALKDSPLYKDAKYAITWKICIGPNSSYLVLPLSPCIGSELCYNHRVYNHIDSELTIWWTSAQ